MFRLFPEKEDYVNKEVEGKFDSNLPIPKHIAVIMDGNGRWAQNRRLPRVAGHREGMKNVKRITKRASQMGVGILTLYAFSTENWKRPDSEVDFLMQLPVDFFDEFVPELIEENVKVMVMGYTEYLPEHTRQAVQSAMDKTAHCDGMILNFALNYGSRAEMLTAINFLTEETIKGNRSGEVTEEEFSSYLMTNGLGIEHCDPDLLIRTSGEQRISNFLLWQIAYSELYFSAAYWPDFSGELFEEAIGTFQNRERRYGGLNKEDEKETLKE